MKKMKQVLSVLLAVVMLLCAMPVMGAGAAYENTWTNTGNQRVDIVEVAKTQIGYHEGNNNDTKYGDWYGLSNQAWCAMFVCWCANQAGISIDIVPRFSKCVDDNNPASGSSKFKALEQWKDKSFVPSSGDLIFFTPSHVGIVEYVSGTSIHTIEGNYSDCVKRVTRTVGENAIAGFGTPKYSETLDSVDLGNDFYANIIKCDGWATVGLSNDNVQIVPATGDVSEFWHFVKDSDGAYIIYNCSNNKVLDVYGAGTENGTNVYVYPDCGGANQRWYISGRWNGEYYLRPKNSNKVLDVNNNDNAVGTNLQIWEKNDSTAQQFSIYKYQNIGSDFYANIIECEKWATVGVSDDNVQIVAAAGDASEYWHFVRDSDGSYAIYNCSNNKVLDVYGAGTENGTNVYVYPDCGGTNQRWFILGRWNGEYYLCPKNSNKVLDVYNGNDTIGTNVQIWEKNDSTAQQFSIYEQPKAGVSVLSVAISNSLAMLSWTASTNTDTYNIRIKNTSTGESYDFWKETGTSKTIDLPAGQYDAYIDSCNAYSYTKSNDVSFAIVHEHSYTSTVTAPATCSATGVRTYTCTCGSSYTETIDKNANNHVNTKTVAATASTCTVKGYTAGVYCNDCKKYISGHTEQPLAAHQTTLINAKEATYTADGYTGDTYCTVCKQTLAYGSAIPMLTKPEEPTNPTNPTQPENPTQPTTQQQQRSGSCKYCGQNHTGFPGILIGFFHSILALFGLRK